MASKVNPPSTIVTRKKKRDLEATMKSLKKLLEPRSKPRSRKKNIPRSISKKVSPKKTRSINRFESYENSSEDGEYYPNKLKRKDNIRKIVLKPKHDLKVVIATNKRKRGTPHKGLKSPEEKHTVLNKPSKEHKSNSLPKLSNKTELPTQRSIKPQVSLLRDSRKSPLSIQTSTKITKFGLVSPPHRSLTELTVDDLMRMDEDSLSEDDFMEVLTCPSPVWWEDAPDYFDEGGLTIARTGELDVQNEAIKETADKTSIMNPTSNNIDFKRTETVCETKKSKKMAKLENILGNIKNRVQNKSENIERIADKEIANETSNDKSVANDNGNDTSNVSNKTDDHDEIYLNLKETSEGNKLQNNENDVTKHRDCPIGVDDIKRRKISSSGSDMSVNDEDLLRNLENIDIPIHIADTDGTNDKNYKQNSEENDGEPKAVTNAQDMEIQTTNRSTNKEAARPDTKDIDTNMGKVKTDKHKDILKPPKNQNDDILDVRLIKIPTNTTNQVRIWSKVENFYRHNLKPEHFDEVIDIENELVFSMIKCNNQLDPETICIDDDDDEQIPDAIDLDAIGKVNDKIDSNFTDMAEIITVNAEKDIIKEDTITISKDLDVRLIETPVAIDEITETHVSVDVITKPVKKNQAVMKDKAIDPPKPKKKQPEMRGIRILPVKMIANVPNSNSKKKNKTRTKNLTQQYAKDKTKGEIKGVKIIKTKNDNVIRINDLDISIIKANDHNVKRNKTYEVKNDLCITLVTKDNKSDKEINKRIEVPSKTPVILPPLKRIVKSSNRSDKGKATNQKSLRTPVTLPSLIKNPNNNFESPKSINSISSETTDAEGTISDTNIQFLDEYDDDKISVDIVFEGRTTDVEDTDNKMKSKDSIKSPAQMCIEKQVKDNYTKKISVSGEK